MSEAAAEKVVKPTEYVILHGVDGEPDTYTVAGKIEGMNKDAAINTYTDALPDDQRGGAWKAVSASSWKGGQVIAVAEVVETKRTPLDG